MRVFKGQSFYSGLNKDERSTFHQLHTRKRTLIGLTGLSYK